MAGIPLVTNGGPRTYTPKSGATVKGGQLVEGTTTAGRVQVASAGSVKVLGVALKDAIAPEDVTSTVTGTPPTLAAVPANTEVTVAYGGVEVPVTYAANAALGDLLVAAANGAVTPAAAPAKVTIGEGDVDVPADPRLIIGRCTEPGGVTVATNPVGLARITV